MVTGYLNDQDTALRSWIDPYDLPHVLTISSGYELPFFQRSSNRLLKQALGGWALNVIYSYSSGQLFAAPAGVQSTGLSPRILNPTRAHEFNTCTKGLKEAAASTGVDRFVLDNHHDSATVVKNMQEFVRNRVDFVLESQVDPEVSPIIATDSPRRRSLSFPSIVYIRTESISV